MQIRSGDIRDRSRKLSEIALKFGRFLALPNIWGQAFQKLYAAYHPCLAARRQEKFREDTPAIPEVIEAHDINFRPDFLRATAYAIARIMPSPVRLSVRHTGGSVENG